MQSRDKGLYTRLYAFTLIELATVVLIVAILSAVLTPIMHSLRDRAIWSEAYAGAGSLASGIRVYCLMSHEGHAPIAPGGDFSDFDVYDVDLRGKYFQPANYSVSEVTCNEDGSAVRYRITVSAPDGVAGPGRTLDENGQWGEATPSGG